jgi:hypothetical protein
VHIHIHGRRREARHRNIRRNRAAVHYTRRTRRPGNPVRLLRAISLFIAKYPKALAKETRVFFCKYNDPTTRSCRSSTYSSQSAPN